MSIWEAATRSSFCYTSPALLAAWPHPDKYQNQMYADLQILRRYHIESCELWFSTFDSIVTENDDGFEEVKGGGDLQWEVKQQ